MANRSQNYFVGQALDKFGTQYVSEIIKLLVEADKQVTGELIKSLDYNIIKTANGFIMKILAAPYFTYVDQGVGPAAGHARGRLMNGELLVPWIRARGIQPARGPFVTNSTRRNFQTLEDVGWAIARKIQRDGIAPTYVMERARQNLIESKIAMTKIVAGAKLDLNAMINDFILDINLTVKNVNFTNTNG